MAPKRVAAAKAGTTKNTQSPIRKSTSTADERAKARHERQAATKAATEARLAEDAKAADRARQIAEKKRADRAKNGAKRQAALKKAAAKSEPTTTTATKKRKATAAEDEPTPKHKNTATTKKASGLAKKNTTSTTSTKRKAVEPAQEPPAKKAKTSRPPPKARALATTTKKPVKRASKTTATPSQASPTTVLNSAPTARLDVLVFGGGESAELGLGTAPKTTKVSRPRLHPMLLAGQVGLVQVACGAMHSVALSHNNKVLTWGANDDMALGRKTKGKYLEEAEKAEKEKKAAAKGDDSDSEDDDDETNGLSILEAKPVAIPDFPPAGVTITQVAAGDSVSLALTSSGNIYGWGNFRDNNGNFGFSVDRNWDTGKQSTDPDLNPETENVGAQLEPVLILDVTKKPLSGIVSVACGANHCLALDKDGNVWSWGTGQQMQLGHQIVERNRYAVLIPERCDLPKKKMKAVYTSEDHCFAVDKDENVWSWGLNNMGQCGITEGAGRDGNFVCPPKKVDALAGRKIVSFGLGRKHTVAVDEQGEVLAWGNVESGALGIDVSTVPEDAVLRGERQEIKVVAVPQVVPGIPAAAWVASGVDHNIAITKDGKAYSWGFGAEGQLGQGPGEDEVTPTVIANTAVKDKVLNWAGCGAGFSVVTAVAV